MHSFYVTVSLCRRWSDVRNAMSSSDGDEMNEARLRHDCQKAEVSGKAEDCRVIVIVKHSAEHVASDNGIVSKLCTAVEDGSACWAP